MEPHSIQEFHVLDGIAPVVIAIIFIIGSSPIKEPNRRNFMAIMIAGAGAAYLSGGARSANGNLFLRELLHFAPTKGFTLIAL